MGARLFFQINDSETINWFSMNHDNYRKITDTLFLPNLMEHSLLVAGQELWRRQRKFISPLFMHEQIQNKTAAMNYHADDLVQSLKTDPESRKDLLRVLSKTTGDMICNTFFGREITQ